jgi:hypothetical protein
MIMPVLLNQCTQGWVNFILLSLCNIILTGW